jgi:hypothetical protein
MKTERSKKTWGRERKNNDRKNKRSPEQKGKRRAKKE